MTRFAERDEYQVSALVGGLPTCTFRPKMYHRIITNIVVGNTAAGSVTCYRGILGSTPVAQNQLGASNTLRGSITIPAGQTFYVQWSAVGSAFARVSWERSDNPLDPDGTDQDWDSTIVDPITFPSTSGPGQARFVLGTQLPPPLNTYVVDTSLGSTTYKAAIIIYGTDVDTYQYIGLLADNAIPNLFNVHWGAVVNGAVVEDANFSPQHVPQAFRMNVDPTIPGTINQFNPNRFNVFADTEIILQCMDPGGLNLMQLVSDAIELYPASNARLQSYFLTASHAFVSVKGLTSTSKNTNTFSDYPDNIHVDITKDFDASVSAVMVRFDPGYFIDNANASPEFAVNDGSTDWVTRFIGATDLGINSHKVGPGAALLTGLAAGNYTITGRWRNVTATGNIWADGGDMVTLEAWEVSI